MPISAEQWRATTGSMNIFRMSRTCPQYSRLPSLCDLPSPPPSSWKGYIAALILLCIPLIYKLHLVVIMLLASASGGTHGLMSFGSDSNYGFAFRDKTVFERGAVPLFLLNAVFYVAMVISVVLVCAQGHRRRDQHQWKLTQQLHHLDLYWLNSGQGCEVIYDPSTYDCYAVLTLDVSHSERTLYYAQKYCRKLKMNTEFVAHLNKRNTISGFVSVLQLSTIVVAMLLLLAGDVERNPGPLPGLDLKTLSVELSSAKDKWHEIGIQLGIGIADLKAIEEQYRRVDRRLSEALVFWLKGNTKELVCWESILKALKSPTVNENGLAEELYVKAQAANTGDDGNESSEEPSDYAGALNIRETKQSTYTFPYLDLSEYNKTQAEAMKAKLCKDFYKMTEMFQELLHSIGMSLEKENKSVHDILTCISQYKTLEPVYTSLEEKNTMFRHQIPELKKATSIAEAMNIVSEYASFFNYCLVKQIIKRLGTSEDKQKLAEYEEEFRNYAKQTVYQCPQLGIASSEDRLSFLVKVHQEGFEECSIGHLRQFINKLSEIFDLPDGILLLESVVPGCLELVLQLPPSSYHVTFPLIKQQEEALAALGVIKILARDYQYSSLQDTAQSHAVYHYKEDKRKPDSDSGYNTHGSTTLTSDFSDFDQEFMKPNSTTYERQSIGPGQLNGSKRQTKFRCAYQANVNQPIYHAFRGHQLELDYFIDNENQVTTNRPVVFNQLVYDNSLHLLAYEGNFERIKCKVTSANKLLHLLDRDETYGMTILHSASIGGNSDTVHYLIRELVLIKGSQSMKDIVCDATKHGVTPLHLAAAYGHLEIVKYLIDLKCASDVTIEGTGLTPLHFAAIGGHLKIVNYLINEQKCKPSQLDNMKYTPLHFAASLGHLDIVRFLTTVDIPYNLTFLSSLGYTPVHDAAITGQIAVVKYFVASLKCDPNIKNPDGSSPLHTASYGGHVEIAQFLINEMNCTPSQTNDYKLQALHFAAEMGHMDIVKMLIIDKQCDPKCKDAIGNTPLHFAALSGFIEITRFLVSKISCPVSNLRNSNGASPLHAAAMHGRVEVIKYLVDDCKCDPNQVDYRNHTPLVHAAGDGHLESVKLLVQHYKCDPSKQYGEAGGPIHHAAQEGRLDVLKFFLEDIKCDPNTPGRNGSTPIHYAALGGHVEIMKYLIAEYRCNPFLTNLTKAASLHLAAKFGKLNVIQFLTQISSDTFKTLLKTPDIEGNNPLHFAANKGFLDIVKYFISEWKCDPNIRGKLGYTSLHAAAEGGHEDIVEFLICDQKCNSSAENHIGGTPLHLAARQGHLKVVKILTCSLPNRDARSTVSMLQDQFFGTPLHYAAFGGHIHVVKYLIEKLHCAPDIRSTSKVSLFALPENFTPIQMAYRQGHQQVVEYLHHARVNLVNSGIKFYYLYFNK